MPEPRTFVLVGHCGPDMYMLRTAVSRSVPGAKLVTANDQESLRAHLAPNAVLLVNRVLDGRFDDEGGIGLIRQIAALPDPPLMMLISNFAEAQEEAVAAGARPGFGKKELYAEATAQRLRDAASSTTTSLEIR